MLAAIPNGNMFRDMSGLAATVGLAPGGDAAGVSGGPRGGGPGGSKCGQRGEGFLRGLAASQTPNTISNAGARINHGADMDVRRAAARRSGPVPVGCRCRPRGVVPTARVAGRAPRSQEELAFRNAVAGPLDVLSAAQADVGPAVTPAVYDRRDVEDVQSYAGLWEDLLKFQVGPEVEAGLQPAT